MATTTANISVSSDIASTTMSTSAASVLYTAGTTTGLNTMTSVTKVLSSTDDVDLITTGSVSTTHAYVYINNPSADHTEYFHIKIGNAKGSSGYDAETIGSGTEPDEEIGRLYGGDWMWFPWDVDDDITVKPSVATDMTIEYMVFS
jgi:hypothetical protein|tara:strand:+ start:319 stop:756 length:438 start_codon:yes stop_codon:yes gene_type:complete